jgi:hypothetical protein
MLDWLDEEPPMLVHRVRILVSQRLKERRRPFVISEEEGDAFTR